MAGHCRSRDGCWRWDVVVEPAQVNRQPLESNKKPRRDPAQRHCRGPLSIPSLGSVCRFDDEGREVCPADGTWPQLFENLVGGQASELPLLPLLCIPISRYSERHDNSFVCCQVHALNLAVSSPGRSPSRSPRPHTLSRIPGRGCCISLEFSGFYTHPETRTVNPPDYLSVMVEWFDEYLGG